MTEICFKARVGTATVAIESVTATVINLYVYWKPGFMLNLEAWLSLAVKFNGSMTRQQLRLTVASNGSNEALVESSW